MFEIIQGNGFQITFDNKYIICVQWGHANQPISNTAEVAVYGEDGYGIQMDGKNILGQQSPEQVADLIVAVSKR